MFTPTPQDIAIGLQAYVRAVVSVVLGQCVSRHGATCIPGDARLAWLYAEATGLLLEEEGEGTPRGGKTSGGDSPGSSDDPEDYPDL